MHAVRRDPARRASCLFGAERFMRQRASRLISEPASPRPGRQAPGPVTTEAASPVARSQAQTRTGQPAEGLETTDRRLRVAHVAESFAMGGLEKLLVAFARHADRASHALRFVAMGERGCLAEEIEAAGWPVDVLDQPLGRRPRLVLRLAALFRREGIDVVHTHSSGPLIYAVPAARLAGVRVVVHTRHHGQDPHTSSRALAVCRFLSRAIDRVVCVSNDGVAHATSEGIAPRKLAAIWNGIDTDQFRAAGPRPLGPAVIVARLSPEKDVATLLRATALVVEQEPGFRLAIAGDGPCRRDLAALSSTLWLDAHVKFLGQVRDIPALLATASLLVLPSLMEGISLTLLEAMAHGLPVVATRVGGNPEVVVQGQTGLLVPPQAPDDLARTLLRLWRDPETGRRMGRAARERAVRCFDVRRTVAEYEQLYGDLHARRHSPR
jgi:glycosyltransferase involved in cell wall biosynthesis